MLSCVIMITDASARLQSRPERIVVQVHMAHVVARILVVLIFAVQFCTHQEEHQGRGQKALDRARGVVSGAKKGSLMKPERAWCEVGAAGHT